MLDWQLPPDLEIPTEFIAAVRKCKPNINGKYAARLLWQRGITDIDLLPGYLDSDHYQPTSPFAFGGEMTAAMGRLTEAYFSSEKVTIWGDFDADGITATSVLLDGLGQFFTEPGQLNYYIPDRLKESHGLNISGIDKLAAQGTNLIVTCDTGSTNIKEIDYAAKLGIDIIITDHHTLPIKRPAVIAIINPRYFDSTHPFFHLAGVAVAYKLIEALYLTLPDIPHQPVEYLLDLVAIGLIADLVQLKGDCRYLAQAGIKRITLQNKKDISGFRPGLHQLLILSKKTGDRPTDVSFGIGPRINAISRIHGEASFGVELLTSKNFDRCKALADQTELANTRRKEVQKNTLIQVNKKLAKLDLSTTSVIVLVDNNWSPGVLGLVAGQIAQEHGKPTILLSTSNDNLEQSDIQIARGSARSTRNIDLYQLVNSQAHLLNSFGGHPFAAGLSINVDNLPIFIEAIDRQLSTTLCELSPPSISIDLVVTCAELNLSKGQELFEDLLLLEPYGMGNSVPKLLIKNCRFRDVKNKNIRDKNNQEVKYIKTEFEIIDNTTKTGFPGIWWGHYQDEIPVVDCDVIVELDVNLYNQRWEVRLIEIRPAAVERDHITLRQKTLEILDFRRESNTNEIQSVISIDQCPKNWAELQIYARQASQTNCKLALNYQTVKLLTSREIFEQLIEIARHRSNHQQNISLSNLRSELDISDRLLHIGLEALIEIGFHVSYQQDPDLINIRLLNSLSDHSLDLFSLPKVNKFWRSIDEEHFYRQYFLKVPVYTLEAGLAGS